MIPPTRITQASLSIISIGTLLWICYAGKPIWATILMAMMLAFVMEPLVELQERIHIGRPLGAAIALILLSLVIYSLVHFSFLKTVDFMDELPQYTSRIQEQVKKFRKSSKRIDD